MEHENNELEIQRHSSPIGRAMTIKEIIGHLKKAQEKPQWSSLMKAYIRQWTQHQAGQPKHCLLWLATVGYSGAK